MSAGTVSYLGAFGGGVVSFLSPCVLPLVPAYLSVVTGLDLGEIQAGARRQLAPIARDTGLFVAGFSAVFILLGLSATTIGRTVFANKATLTRISGVVVVAMALFLVGSLFLRAPWLYQEKRFHPSASRLGQDRVGVHGRSATPAIGEVAYRLEGQDPTDRNQQEKDQLLDWRVARELNAGRQPAAETPVMGGDGGDIPHPENGDDWPQGPPQPLRPAPHPRREDELERQRHHRAQAHQDQILEVVHVVPSGLRSKSGPVFHATTSRAGTMPSDTASRAVRVSGAPKATAARSAKVSMSRSRGAWSTVSPRAREALLLVLPGLGGTHGDVLEHRGRVGTGQAEHPPPAVEGVAEHGLARGHQAEEAVKVSRADLGGVGADVDTGAVGVRPGVGQALGQPVAALGDHFEPGWQPRTRLAGQGHNAPVGAAGRDGVEGVGQGSAGQGGRLLQRARRAQAGLDLSWHRFLGHDENVRQPQHASHVANGTHRSPDGSRHLRLALPGGVRHWDLCDPPVGFGGSPSTISSGQPKRRSVIPSPKESIAARGPHRPQVPKRISGAPAQLGREDGIGDAGVGRSRPPVSRAAGAEHQVGGSGKHRAGHTGQVGGIE